MEIELPDVTPNSSPEEVAAPEKEAVKEDAKIPAEAPAPEPEAKKEEKTVPYSRFKEVSDKLKEAQGQKSKGALDVEDYIDISSSLDGLDPREKEYLASQHKLSGKPLKEIRSSEDFTFWQSAYRNKVEKEKSALRPSGTQSESELPKSFDQKLENASLEEKEKLLTEAGLYKPPRRRTDHANIGK